MLERMQACFLLPTSLITAAMCVNSAEKSLNTTALVASGVVAINLENNFEISFIKIDPCFKVT